MTLKETGRKKKVIHLTWLFWVCILEPGHIHVCYFLIITTSTNINCVAPFYAYNFQLKENASQNKYDDENDNKNHCII